MVQTKEGSIKMMATMRKKYGGKKGVREFFQRIGKTGGENGHTGGFAADRDRAVESGRVGGSKSRRGLKYMKEKNGIRYYVDNNTGKVVKYQYDMQSQRYERLNRR